MFYPPVIHCSTGQYVWYDIRTCFVSKAVVDFVAACYYCDNFVTETAEKHSIL